VGEPRPGVAPAGADDTGQVRRLDPVGVDRDDLADTEARQVLVDEGAGATEADDPDL
jgi:hypothetical protein